MTNPTRAMTRIGRRSQPWPVIDPTRADGGEASAPNSARPRVPTRFRPSLALPRSQCAPAALRQLLLPNARHRGAWGCGGRCPAWGVEPSAARSASWRGVSALQTSRVCRSDEPDQNGSWGVCAGGCPIRSGSFPADPRRAAPRVADRYSCLDRPDDLASESTRGRALRAVKW